MLASKTNFWSEWSVTGLLLCGSMVKLGGLIWFLMKICLPYLAIFGSKHNTIKMIESLV